MPHGPLLRACEWNLRICCQIADAARVPFCPGGAAKQGECCSVPSSVPEASYAWQPPVQAGQVTQLESGQHCTPRALQFLAPHQCTMVPRGVLAMRHCASFKRLYKRIVRSVTGAFEFALFNKPMLAPARIDRCDKGDDIISGGQTPRAESAHPAPPSTSASTAPEH